MKFCPECGATLVTQKFCQECGANISKYTGGASLDTFDFSALQNQAHSQLAYLARFELGGTPTFGSYFINNGSTKEPIEWIVLAREENRALLVSKYALDFKRYHMRNEYVTWENCTLRTYLNNEFLYNSFSAEEQSKILTTCNENLTNDKIFLLSVDEVKKYFKSNSERICKATPYVMSLDTESFTSDRRNWWLRSPSCGQIYSCYYALTVYAVGDINTTGSGVIDNTVCIRPALWLNLE